MLIRLRLGIVGFTLLLAGCTSFRRTRSLETLPAQAAPRGQYQVWTRGGSQLLIALRVTGDSLSGVPSWRAPDCDSCRASIPRGEVDSVRVRGFDGNKTLVLAIIVTPLLWVLYAFRGMSDPNY